MISVEQMKAGRALLRMSQEDLSTASNVSLATIKRIEAKSGPLSAYQRTIDALRQALESAGVEFIDANGGGPGVRLSLKASQKSGDHG